MVAQFILISKVMAHAREGNPRYKLQLEAEGPRVALALESRRPGILVAKDDRRGKKGLYSGR